MEAIQEPAYLGRPLRLHAFCGLTLAPRRIGGAVSLKALARPYRDQPGALTVDAAAAVYLHEYTVGGLTIRGLVGALELTRRTDHRTDSPVLPHESVQPARVAHLAERMLQLELQPAPILLVHRGPAEVRSLVHDVMSRPADRAFSDRAQQHHRLWALRDADLLARLSAGLADSTVVIGDGHHRYAAYLQLQQEHPGTAWDRGLAMLVDQDDTPLHLGPIHRVLPGVTLDELADLGATRGWTVRRLTQRGALDALAPSTVIISDGRSWASLTVPATAQGAVVDILHGQLLSGLARTPRLGYHHGVDTAVRAVRRRSGVAVLMPAPEFDQVRHVVSHQLLFPQKATSFQPKPSVGVLMRSTRAE